MWLQKIHKPEISGVNFFEFKKLTFERKFTKNISLKNYKILDEEEGN
jgi:hypothetical protein